MKAILICLALATTTCADEPDHWWCQARSGDDRYYSEPYTGVAVWVGGRRQSQPIDTGDPVADAVACVELMNKLRAMHGGVKR